MESKVDVSFAEKEKGVQGAFVIDLEGRVLAPARKFNQYLTEANEAAFSAIARERFNKKEKLEETWKVYGTSVYVAVPLRIFNQSQGKNLTAAISIVAYDRSMLLFDDGTLALTYIQALILTAILSVVGYFSLYRLTLKPLSTLNDDIDMAIKNNSGAISPKFKMSEIAPLIDIVNVAISRAGGASSSLGGAAVDTISADESLGSLRFMADHMNGTGVMIVSTNKQVLHLNASMEEITGIRAQQAAGAEFSTVARDQAFTAFVDDIVARASSGMPISEDFDFSGTDYKMECIGVGGQAGAAKFIVIAAKKVA